MFVSETGPDIVIRGFALAALALTWVTILIRVNGLRTLSKMTNFDFVMTVAMGSVVAGAVQADNWEIFAQAIVGMGGLVLVQFIAARLRSSSELIEQTIQNEPLLIMRDGKILHDALNKARMSESDVIAKLREANALELDQVRAVVLETTGDVSVLHGERFDEELLQGIRNT